MLGSPSVAVLEQVLPGLSRSAAPPALVVLPQFDPLQVSSRKGVPYFQLVESGGDAFLCFCGRRVHGLSEAFGVESGVLDSGERPLVGLLPFLVADAPLEVGQGCW